MQAKGSCPRIEPVVHIIHESENLGEIILGDRIETSLYQIGMKNETTCAILCKKDLRPQEVKTFRDRINEEYRVHWILDQLPVANKVGLIKQLDGSEGTFTYETGFPLGEKRDKEYILNNHVDIVIHVSKAPVEKESWRIVFFEVNPRSINYKSPQDTSATLSTCVMRPVEALSVKDVDKPLLVVFTYSVSWVESTTPWSNRWDKYLQMRGDGQVHWFSILNSLMIVLFLTGMVAMILMRTLHADLRRYNAQDPEEPDETGWKLVHGDVFRAPKHPMLFSVLVGSGVQVGGMGVVVIIFAVLGFLSPANRGGLMTAMLVLFVWMGVFGGYFSTRNYKNLGGEHWKKNTLMTAFFFPGIVFGTFFFLSFFLWGEHSSGGVPFGTFAALVILWFGISVPLCFFGSYFAWKKDADKQPVRTNQIPRQIPSQVWYMHPVFSVLMGGILPFGAVFIELFFILSSIWLHKFYYLFGFLFIVFLILMLTCAEITVVMCYFQLCSEDYHWWWRSFLTSAASAFYMFLYSIFYFATKLEITKFVSTVLYFGYSFIMCFGFFVLTGSVGFYACYFFVRKIYGYYGHFE